MNFLDKTGLQYFWEKIKTQINNSLAANDAMTFKGTIGTGGTVTALPATHKVGDIYLYGVGGYEGDNASDSKSIQSVIQDSQSGGDYTLPIASADTLGGIKVGEGLNIDGEGILSSTGGGVGMVDPNSGGTGEIFNYYETNHILANRATGEYAHAESRNNEARGNYSHAEGYGTIANGDNSHVEGLETIANNQCEHAQGMNNVSNTGSSNSDKTIHSIGIGVDGGNRKNAVEVMQNGDNYIYGIGGYDGTNYSEAQTLQEVVNSLSSGSGSGVGKVDHQEEVEGQIVYGEIFNVYKGEYANKVTNTGAHAEGAMNTANGAYSHAEGIQNYVGGTCGHVEGGINNSLGDYAHAEGNCTQTKNSTEHAEGTYNKSNKGETPADKTQHSIGIGTGVNARKNAVEVMKNGDAYIVGIGGYDGTNYQSANTLQETISSIENKIWTGSQESYDALETKDENTLYFITE